MKAYTGGGDQGKTSLLSGERVAKSSCRIEACGDVDELNCVLGALVASLSEQEGDLRDEMLGVQGDLFLVGAWLATLPGSPAAGMLAPFDPSRTRRLEALTDGLDGQLAALQGFILPGGHPAAAWAHLARAVCRRAERRVVQCSRESEESGAALRDLLPYLNRLSSLLFVVARLCNKQRGVAERTWQG